MPSGQKMKMDMEDRLPGVGIVIGDDPEARFRHPPLPRQTRRHHVDMADQLPVLRRDVETVDDMLPRDQEEMMRCLWGNILDGDDKVVFIDRLCGNGSGNDLAKYAVLHGEFPRIR